MKRIIYLIVFIPFFTTAQIVIPAGINVAVEGTPDIVVQAPADITNNSASFDFTNTNFILKLVGGDQFINGAWVMSDLSVDGGGTKNTNRPVTITNSLTFVNGIITPNGKLLYTGAHDHISGASDASYVNGPFSVMSEGRMTFPVGVPTFGFAPAYLEDGNGTDEVTVQLVATGAGLTPAATDAELVEIDNTHYWQVTSADLASLSSRVTLNTLGAVISADLSPVVVQSPNVNGTATNLGSSSVSSDAVTSRAPITESILVIGGSAEIELKIHNLITPFTKGDANDYLYIESIEKFDFNRVTLMDRWGVVIKEWSNFTNYDDPINPNSDGYDFARLSPGNYICVVEYGFTDGGARKKSQMITVLKAK